MAVAIALILESVATRGGRAAGSRYGVAGAVQQLPSVGCEPSGQTGGVTAWGTCPWARSTAASLPPSVAAEPVAGALASGEAFGSEPVVGPGVARGVGWRRRHAVGGGEVVSSPVPCPLSVVLWSVPKRPPPRWSGLTACGGALEAAGLGTPPLALTLAGGGGSPCRRRSACGCLVAGSGACPRPGR